MPAIKYYDSETHSWKLANDIGGGGGEGEQEVFLATFGTTTYDAIAAAVNAGKIVQCVRTDGRNLRTDLVALEPYDGAGWLARAVFSGVYDAGIMRCEARKMSGGATEWVKFWDVTALGSTKLERDYQRIPVINLVGDISNWTSKETEKSFEFTYDRDAIVELGAQQEAAVHLTGYATAKWQGNSSVQYEKKNYTIKLFTDAAHTTPKSVELKDGWGSRNKYVLKANFIDPTHTRNITAARVWNQMVQCRNTASESYIRLHDLDWGGAIDGFPVILKFNGDYKGVYSMNIPKDENLFGMDGTNTQCVLCGESEASTVWFNPASKPTSIDGVNWSYEVEPTNPNWVVNSFGAIYDVLGNTSRTRAQLEAVFDVYSAIDYAIFVDYLGVGDICAKNQLLVTFDGTKWFYSAYDLDNAYGNRWDGKKFLAPDDNYNLPVNSNVLLRTVKEMYQAEYNARRDELLQSVLVPEKIFADVLNQMKYVPQSLLDAEAALYYTTPNTNANGFTQIANYIPGRIAYLTGGTGDVFTAIYGTTTYSQVAAAVNGGKRAVCKRLHPDGRVIVYDMVALESYRAVFGGVYDGGIVVCEVSVDGWNNGLYSSVPRAYPEDNGKFLRVVNGAWTAATVNSAENGTF